MMADSEQAQRAISRRTFLRGAFYTVTGTILAGSGGILYGMAIEPDMLDVISRELVLPRLDPAFDGYQVTQISDIHMDDWMTPERLQMIVDQVNVGQPDMIVITGDFVTHTPERHAESLVATLGTLSAPDGVFAVPGNHDHWTRIEVVREIIRQSNITDLSNRHHTLTRDGQLLHLAGVDDVWVKAADLDRVLSGLPADGAAILLAHEPDFADTSAASGRFDLQLSGHSHGGQVVLPLMGAPILPRLGRKYPAGLYRVGEMLQYTSRGVGMIEPRIRFNCRPEITRFTLRSPQVSA